jgi:hypothetical protein
MFRVITNVIGILCIALLLCATARTATAAEILTASAEPTTATDDFYFTSIGITGSVVAADAAETFTPTVSGTLSRIGLQVFKEGTPTAPLEIEIRPVIAGAPAQSNSDLIGLITVDAAQLPSPIFPTLVPTPTPANLSWSYFDCSSLGIRLTAGQPLALVLMSGQPYYFPDNYTGYDWFSSNQGQDIYPAGDSWDRLGGSTDAWQLQSGGAVTDFSFQIFVNAPEPSTITLAALGVLAFLAIPRRR